MGALDMLHREGFAARGLAASLRERGFLDDDDLIADAIEGETDAMEAVSRVLRWMAEQDAMAAACKTQEEALASRRKRFKARDQAGRAALADLMEAVGLPKIERPEATVSLRAGGQSVVYSPDLKADDLPEELVRVKREPDGAAIMMALVAGHDIHGAALSNSPPVLTIRRA